MAAAFRDSSYATDGSFTSNTVNSPPPAGAVEGDLEVIFFSSGAFVEANVVHTTPPGWTLIATQAYTGFAGGALFARSSMYYRIAPNPPGTTVCTSAGPATHTAMRHAYSGIDQAAPFGQGTVRAGANSPIQTDSLTTTKPNALLVAMMAQGAAQSATTPGGFTTRIDQAAQGVHSADGIQASPGATGNISFTTPSNSEWLIGFAEFWPFVETGVPIAWVVA